MNHVPHHLDDRASWRAALVLAAIVLVGYGFLYSLVGTALGRALFPCAASGSLLEQGGKLVGSALVAQPFTDARYFSPRPSAANYDPMRASGSTWVYRGAGSSRPVATLSTAARIPST